MSSYTGIKRFTTSKAFTKRVSVIVRLIIAVILIFFSIFPVLWIISSSLNPANSLASAKLIPDNWGFDNFYILLPSAGAAIRQLSVDIFGSDIFPPSPKVNMFSRSGPGGGIRSRWPVSRLCFLWGLPRWRPLPFPVSVSRDARRF